MCLFAHFSRSRGCFAVDDFDRAVEQAYAEMENGEIGEIELPGRITQILIEFGYEYEVEVIVHPCRRVLH